MKLGWKRSPKPTPTGAAPSAEPCGRRCTPRIIRSSYWVRSSLITDTSVVCSNCGQSLDPARANGH